MRFVIKKKAKIKSFPKAPTIRMSEPEEKGQERFRRDPQNSTKETILQSFSHDLESPKQKEAGEFF